MRPGSTVAAGDAEHSEHGRRHRLLPVGPESAHRDPEGPRDQARSSAGRLEHRGESREQGRVGLGILRAPHRTSRLRQPPVALYVTMNLKLHFIQKLANLTVLVDGGVDGGLGTYSGVWTAHRRAVPRRNLSLIEKINALPGPTLPSSRRNSRCDAQWSRRTQLKLGNC